MHFNIETYNTILFIDSNFIYTKTSLYENLYETINIEKTTSFDVVYLIKYELEVPMKALMHP